jgi:hypothetical protein
MRVMLSSIRISAVLALLAFAPAAFACRCVEPVPPKTAYRHASAVVMAKVLDVRTDVTQQSSTARIAVSQHWKLETPAEFEVFTDTNCAYPFESGREYVLFLLKDRPMPGYVSGRCMGNQPTDGDKAAPVLRWLRKNGAAKSATVVQ